jgi:2-polyprenyl-6-methoxyphenol hydroxylase-like FAD-dependent oxidoreductase
MGSADPVIVVGGSIGGLATALALGRAGERVIVLERDDIHLADDAEQAFAVDRAGAPQAHQTHGFLARLVVTLRERFPDVLEQIIASGARVISMTSELEGVEEGDDDLAVLIVRRTTFEWALRKAVLGEPNTEVRGGVGVRGLLADTSGDGPPRVTGVVLEDGSELTAKAVVVASGRRGLVEPWLAPFGVAVPEELHETGHVYLTRWYRFQGEVDLAKHTRLGGDLGWLKFLAIPGDGDTLSATLAVRTQDRDVRALLADAKRFDTALRMLPGPAALLEETRAEAITDVLPMAGLINRLRRFVDRPADGARLPRGRRRAHLHQPALRARLLAGDRAGDAPRRRVRRPPRRRHRPRSRLRGGERPRGRALVPLRGDARLVPSARGRRRRRAPRRPDRSRDGDRPEGSRRLARDRSRLQPARPARAGVHPTRAHGEGRRDTRCPTRTHPRRGTHAPRDARGRGLSGASEARA